MKTVKDNQSGAAAIEFALVLPVLVLILFGIIEFSIMLYDKAMITNASREGARAGIVYAYPDRVSETEIIAVVNQYCQDHLISFDEASTVSTNVTPGTGAGDPLTVNVTYEYGFLVLPNFMTGLTGPINLSAETVMRME